MAKGNAMQRKGITMEKQEKHNIGQKILVCRDIEEQDEKGVYYFKCSENQNMSFGKNQYIYKFTMENMKRRTSVFQIVDIIEDEKVRENIIELEANEVLRPISCRCSWKIREELYSDTVNFTLEELQKEIRNMFRALKWELYFAKLEIIDEDRKKYLFDTFGVEDEIEFKKRKLNSKIKWFKEFNTYDMDFQFVISLYELKPFLLDFIDKNVIICNIDKMALKAKCVDEIEDIVASTFLRENARTQMDSYIGVDFCDETKELIWGYMSPCEIKVEFCFFWTLIKSMLSLAYIPAVILLLQDKNTKIYMYVFLALVYLIAIIFSDEKQVDRLLVWKNSFGKERLGYVDLYYCGLILSTTFVIFSIQLARGCIGNMADIILYLFADTLFAYVIIILFNLCISLFAWGATLIVSVSSIRKKGNHIWKGMKRIIKTLFWLCGLGCSFIVLDIKKYFVTNTDDDLGIVIFVFLFCIIVTEIKIIILWRKEETIEKSVNQEEV